MKNIVFQGIRITVIRVITSVGIRWTWANLNGFAEEDIIETVEECREDIRQTPRYGYLTLMDAVRHAEKFHGLPF